MIKRIFKYFRNIVQYTKLFLYRQNKIRLTFPCATLTLNKISSIRKPIFVIKQTKFSLYVPIPSYSDPVLSDTTDHLVSDRPMLWKASRLCRHLITRFVHLLTDIQVMCTSGSILKALFIQLLAQMYST